MRVPVVRKPKDERITRFRELVQQGVDAWIAAGELLCEMKNEDPNVFAKLMQENPGLSFQVLETFERLGRHEIYPKLLLDGSMGARKLLTLPYSEQERLFDAEISVAVWRRDEIVVVRRKIQEMTERDAKIAFTATSVRPVNEQMKLMRPQTKILEDARSFAPPERYGPAPPQEEVSVVKQAPSAKGCLRSAQSELLRARELICEEKSIAPAIEKLFTAALNAIGNLRFELKAGDE